MCFHAFLLQFQSSTKNGTRLHLSNLRICITQTTSTVSQHRVMFAKRFYTLLDIVQANTHSIRHFLLTFQIVGNELMQRRIKQTNCYRTTFHSLEDPLKVSLLVGQYLSQRFATSFCIFRKNHLTHSLNLFTFKEHVFRAAKTDTNSTKVASHSSIMRSIRIGTNLEFRILIS